jgi:hypothetical protein
VAGWLAGEGSLLAGVMVHSLIAYLFANKCLLRGAGIGRC